MICQKKKEPSVAKRTGRRYVRKTNVIRLKNKEPPKKSKKLEKRCESVVNGYKPSNKRTGRRYGRKQNLIRLEIREPLEMARCRCVLKREPIADIVLSGSRIVPVKEVICLKTEKS